MKKKLALALSLAMVMTMALASCSTNGGGDDSKDDVPTIQAKDTKTVAVGAVIIARDDVPEEDIYTLVSTIFENKEAITEQNAKGSELDLDFAASVTSVPYHPGAAKYFAEKGKTVAVKEGAGTGDSKALTFGTGGDTGTYYGFGGVLASYVSNNTGLSVTAVTSGGSQNNIEELDAGNVQLGFVQSDVMSYAYNGERLFDTKIDGFSVVAALYMEQVQIITLDSSIQSVADLNGKNVSIGDLGSGVYFNAIDVLEAYGLSEDDIKPVYQSFGNSVDSLKDKKIDAAFVVAGAPTNAVVDLVSTNNTYMVEIDDEHTQALLDVSPYYSAYTITAGTY